MSKAKKKARANVTGDRVNFLETLLDNLPIALFGKDAKSEYEFCIWNRTAETFWGLKKENIIGKTDYDFFPREQSDFFRRKDQETVSKGVAVVIEEEPITLPSGETKLLRTTKVPVNDRYLIGISEDVTVKREMERQLQEKNNELEERQHFFNSVLDSIPYPVAFLDRDLVYRYVNPVYAAWFGTSVQRILGKSISDIIDSNSLRSIQPYIDKVLTGEKVSYQKTLQFKSGTSKQVHTDYVPYKQPNGMIVGFISVKKELEEPTREKALKPAA